MRKARFRRAVKRSRDLVWVTTIIEASILESTPTDIGQIVVSGDWSNGNVGFDRCTLMAVRGWLSLAQAAAATAAEATGVYMAMYVTDGSVALNSMDPAVATEYVQFDTIWTNGTCMTANTGNQPADVMSRQLDIKARRKLTTASEVRLAASMSSDTATPRANFNGCIRALLRLDPPG